MTISSVADVLVVSLLLSPILAVIFLVLWLKRRRDLKKLTERFSAVIEIDAEVQKARNERDRIDGDIGELRSAYKEKRQVYDRLLEQVAILTSRFLLPNLVSTSRTSSSATASAIRRPLRPFAKNREPW